MRASPQRLDLPLKTADVEFSTNTLETKYSSADFDFLDSKIDFFEYLDICGRHRLDARIFILDRFRGRILNMAIVLRGAHNPWLVTARNFIVPFGV
jgi:hypothetical protein